MLLGLGSEEIGYQKQIKYVPESSYECCFLSCILWTHPFHGTGEERIPAELPWNLELVTLPERGVLVSDWQPSSRWYFW